MSRGIVVFGEWKKDSEGSILVCPLVSFEPMEVGEKGICLRLVYVEHGEQMPRSSGCLQILLTPSQAVQLGKAMLGATGEMDLSVLTNLS